jgi:hypothetical protein
MAVGTVSGLNLDEQWQLIETQSPSAASAATFSSVSGYKRLMLVWKTTPSTGSFVYMSVNNNTTSNDYTSVVNWQAAALNKVLTTSITLDAQDHSGLHAGMVIIENVTQTMPHILTNFVNQRADAFYGLVINTAPITRVDIYPSTGTFTGTVSIYGIAA